MFLMAIMGVLLLVGVILTVWWGGTAYAPWERDPDPGPDEAPAPPSAPGPSRSPLEAPALRYLRGVAIALVGGVWAGALVTGPAVRLVMRLLAATAGDDAQGRLTEAEEVWATSTSAARSACTSSGASSPAC